jgi:hypothetical protein
MNTSVAVTTVLGLSSVRRENTQLKQRLAEVMKTKTAVRGNSDDVDIDETVDTNDQAAVDDFDSSGEESTNGSDKEEAPAEAIE